MFISTRKKLKIQMDNNKILNEQNIKLRKENGAYQEQIKALTIKLNEAVDSALKADVELINTKKKLKKLEKELKNNNNSIESSKKTDDAFVKTTKENVLVKKRGRKKKTELATEDKKNGK